jgi:chromosome partitioning protein
MLRLLAEAQGFRPDLIGRFVLNRCAARTVIARRTAEALTKSEPPALRARIGQRVVFAEAAQTGRLADEAPQGAPAAREIRALADEIDQAIA